MNRSRLSEQRRSKTLVEIDQSISVGSSHLAGLEKNYKFKLPDQLSQKYPKPTDDSNSKSFISDISKIPKAHYSQTHDADKENKMSLANVKPKSPFMDVVEAGGQHQDRDLIDSFLESDLDSVLGEFSEKD